MRSILDLIKKQGRNLFILNIALLVLLSFAGYCLFIEDRTYSDLFKGTCEVHNLDDLEYCYENNYYIRIYLNDVYLTNYGYYVNDNLKAFYVDIDVGGYSFIALVDDDVANEIFSDDNSITYIDGVITKFNKLNEHFGVVDKIKNDYLEQFGEEYTMKDIDSLVIPIQMNAYQNSKSANILSLIILDGLVITAIIFIIKGLLMMMKPNSYKNFSKIENQKNLEEEFENKVVIENKNICLLPSYIIKKWHLILKLKKRKI